MKKLIALLAIFVITSCGMSKKEIAIQACEIIGEYADPSDRINELNKARVQLGKEELKVYDIDDVNFRETDEMIKDSIKYSLCNDLVLNKPIDGRLQQIRGALQFKQAELEWERQKAIKKAKEQRLAREKQQAEEERLAKEKRKAMEKRVSRKCLQEYANNIAAAGAQYRALDKIRPRIDRTVLEIVKERFFEDQDFYTRKKDRCIDAAVNKELARIARIDKGNNKPQDNPDKIILKKDAYKINPKKAENIRAMNECVGLPAEEFKQCILGIFVSKEKVKKYKSND